MRVEADGYVAVPSASSPYRYQLRLRTGRGSRIPRVRGLRKRVRPADKSGADLRPIVRRTCPVRLGARCEPHVRPLRGPVGRASAVPALPLVGGNVQARLRTIGVLGNKHIPIDYLRGSDRAAACVARRAARYRRNRDRRWQRAISVTKRRLAQDAAELIVSLGYRCKRRPSGSMAAVNRRRRVHPDVRDSRRGVRFAPKGVAAQGTPGRYQYCALGFAIHCRRSSDR